MIVTFRNKSQAVYVTANYVEYVDGAILLKCSGGGNGYSQPATQPIIVAIIPLDRVERLDVEIPMITAAPQNETSSP